ncbi:MAG: nucleotidyltransferase domain-containing protein [Firmicutes bacterium]|nr:nucleotidyltransferase domain-containing protein [Bacillota bacterium]
MPVRKAILFGSYAKGTQKKSSDIDIFIDSNGEIRGIDFFGVRADISDALNIPVDLIDARQLVEGGRVQQEIAKTGVVIYERV